jgi:radical SAM superfamily enzyme YgiQ (UPF0313 family)
MSWKRILCLYPYSPRKKSEQLYGGMAIVNPIGLEVVATMAAQYAPVMLVDLRLETQPLDDLIAQFQPDLCLVSVNWGRDKHVDRVMRRLPSEATLMIGGIHPTQYPEKYLDAYPELDLFCMGYGEQTVRELLTKASPRGVRGLWYRDRAKAYPPASRSGGQAFRGNGTLVRNGERYDVAVSHFHINRSLRRYEYPFFGLKGDNIATSIGCPMVCAFCGWRKNIYGEPQKWNPRPAEDVVEEIAETNAEAVHIVDANFAHDARRVEKICDLLIQRDIRRLLCCEIRINALSRSAELVKKMERAGFFLFMIGIEAADDGVLNSLKKGYSVKMCRRAFENLSRTHIVTFGNFVIGVPGQTRADMLHVADYARELGVDFISPNKLYAYPETPFCDWVLQHPGYRIEGRRHYVVSNEIGINDLRRIQRKIYFRFFRIARLRACYRKALSHPMAIKIGRERIREAILGSMRSHLIEPQWRRRLLKKALGRFK